MHTADLSTPTSPRGDLLARGTAIGRFVVLKLLGRGSMGEVYAAHDPELDRKVAIKLLHGNADGSSSDGRARLMREAQAIARVSHPNVVVVYDVGTFRDRVFVAMELVEGHTLGYWMRVAPRTWPEVLEVFSAAGRGLSAAHERALVHRDFKPENVMVGDDGQVRVMDFGLVQLDTRRPHGAAREPDTASAPSATRAGAEVDVQVTQVLTGSSAATVGSTGVLAGELHLELTLPGTTMGTPAYMSPEQFQGRPTDARTDQFSFCVALHEALYGRRPFAGRTMVELSTSVGDGEILEPPEGTNVPPWLYQIVLRGLRPQPELRWPSMSALLAELGQQPAVESRRRFAAAAANKLAGVWEVPAAGAPADTASKTEIRRAFLATGKLYAAKALDGVSQILDAYARRWSAIYVEACEATHVRAEQSAEVLDLRMECLQAGLEDLEALCLMFRQATPEVVQNAVSAANALRGLDRCEDIALLRAVMRPPEDAATREAVSRLRSRLADVRALSGVGRWNDALAAVAPLRGEAVELKYGPLLADVLLAAGALYEDKAMPEEAEQAFREAAWTALPCRHDEAAAEAATRLVYVVGCVQSHPDPAEIWSRLAKALLERMGGHDLMWGWLLTNRAAMRDAQGRLAEALEDAQQAVAAKERALGPRHPDVGYSLSNIAIYLDELGDLDQAVSYARRSVAIVEEGLGPDHPRTAHALSNYSELLMRAGGFDQAAEAAARTLAIFERETDPSGLYVTYPLLVLGLSHLGAGRGGDALPLLERAHGIRDDKETVPARRAEARFALARALREVATESARAVTLARDAQAEYRQAPATPATLRELAAIEQWLAADAAGATATAT